MGKLLLQGRGPDMKAWPRLFAVHHNFQVNGGQHWFRQEDRSKEWTPQSIPEVGVYLNAESTELTPAVC